MAAHDTQSETNSSASAESARIEGFDFLTECDGEDRSIEALDRCLENCLRGFPVRAPEGLDYPSWVRVCSLAESIAHARGELEDITRRDAFAVTDPESSCAFFFRQNLELDLQYLAEAEARDVSLRELLDDLDRVERAFLDDDDIEVDEPAIGFVSTFRRSTDLCVAQLDGAWKALAIPTRIHVGKDDTEADIVLDRSSDASAALVYDTRLSPREPPEPMFQWPIEAEEALDTKIELEPRFGGLIRRGRVVFWAGAGHPSAPTITADRPDPRSATYVDVIAAGTAPPAPPVARGDRHDLRFETAALVAHRLGVSLTDLVHYFDRSRQPKVPSWRSDVFDPASALLGTWPTSRPGVMPTRTRCGSQFVEGTRTARTYFTPKMVETADRDSAVAEVELSACEDNERAGAVYAWPPVIATTANRITLRIGSAQGLKLWREGSTDGYAVAECGRLTTTVRLPDENRLALRSRNDAPEDFEGEGGTPTVLWLGRHAFDTTKAMPILVYRLARRRG